MYSHVTLILFFSVALINGGINKLVYEQMVQILSSCSIDLSGNTCFKNSKTLDPGNRPFYMHTN